jgi:hypothetical protein
MSVNLIGIKMKKFFLSGISTIIGFGSTHFVSAQLVNPLEAETFSQLISKIISIVAEIGLPLAVVVLMYAGFLFVTARGNEEQIKTAKKVFFWAIVGTALILGAWVIAEAINEFLVGLK